MFSKYNIDSLLEKESAVQRLSLNINILRFLGFWSQKKSPTRPLNMSRFIRFPSVMFCLYIVLFVTEVIDVCLVWGNIKYVTENLCVACTILNMTLKMAHFLCKKEQIEELIVGLDIDMHDIDKKNKKEILKDCVKKSQSLTIASFVLVAITAFIWIIFDFGVNCYNGIRKLPLRAWYPFDSTESPFYEITSVLQIVTLTFIPYSYITFTVFYAVLVIHGCGNLRVLRAMIHKATERVCQCLLPKSAETIQKQVPLTRRRKVKVTHLENVYCIDAEGSVLPEIESPSSGTSDRTGNGSEVVFSPDEGVVSVLEVSDQRTPIDFEKEAHLHLREVIRIHLATLRFIKDLDAIYRPVLTIQLVFSLLIIGQVGFLAIALSNQAEGMMKFASYFGCALTELLLYCWYNEELIHEARLVADAAYSCAWCDCAQSFKRSLQIVMIRAQHSGDVPGRGNLTLSCHTGTMILKNSYSLFTLLKQLGDA